MAILFDEKGLAEVLKLSKEIQRLTEEGSTTNLEAIKDKAETIQMIVQANQKNKPKKKKWNDERWD